MIKKIAVYCSSIILTTSVYSSTNPSVKDMLDARIRDSEPRMSSVPESTASIRAWTERDQERSDAIARDNAYERQLAKSMQTGSETPFSDAALAAAQHKTSK